MIGLLILVLVALFGFSLAGTGSGTSGSTSIPRVRTVKAHQGYDLPRRIDPCRGAIPGNRASKLPLPKGCLPPARSGGLPGRMP